MKTTKDTHLIIAAIVAALLTASTFAQPPDAQPVPVPPDILFAAEDLAVPAVEVERQLRVADQQMRDAHRKAEDQFKRVEAMQYGITRPGGGGFEAPLIVASAPVNSDQRAEMEEDLNVMARLVSDAVAEAGGGKPGHRAMGIPLKYFPGESSARNLHVVGHGAIIQTGVGFPLVPNEEKESGEKPKAESPSAWEEARQRLYGGGPGGGPPRGDWDLAADRYKLLVTEFGPPENQAYDAKRVDALKTDVLNALANANHFRHLKPDETVTVVVKGGGALVKQMTLGETREVDLAGPKVKGKPSARGVVNKGGGGGPATLTIRVQKSDADALAAGKIKEEEFRKRADIAVY